MRIVLTGGKTGGHIFPLVATKREMEEILKILSQKYERERKLLEPKFYFVGAKLKDREKKILEEEKIEVKKIISFKWRTYFSFKNFVDIFKFPISLFQSLFHLWKIMPDVILSKGGPGSFAIVLAGWIYRVPIIIHESDIVPGLTNKLSSIFCQKIAISFDKTKEFFKRKKKKIVLTGHPIRQELLSLSKEKAKKLFKITGERKVILIMGGSQGAQQINELIIDAIFKYIEKYEIIHICGPKNFPQLRLTIRGILREDQQKFYHLFPFLDEKKLALAYSIADIIVARGGAGTLFEIAAVQKPAIIIPLSIARKKHQSQNADYFFEKGAVVVIEGDNVTPNFLFAKIDQILEDEKKMEEMKEACKKLAKKTAAFDLAKEVLYTAFK